MSEKETNRDHRLWSVFLRGMAMGAADIVPGVSGGTIAFITGIYFRLLQAISKVPGAVMQQLARGHLRAFWRACDASFLICLLTGVLVSVASLASAITHALEEYPILIWSFFFGLIVASVWHVSGQIQAFRIALLLPLTIGVAFAWWVSGLAGMPVQPSLLMFLGAGALAICAMILPGISGSFILVIMGMYAPVLDAVREPDLAILGVFAIGCVLGLLSIARLITWAFSHFHDLVLALLIGFMVGALNKIWPWKQTLSWRVDSSGEKVPLEEASVSPFSYADLAGQDPQIFLAFFSALAGLTLVLGVEWAGRKK